MSPVLPMRAMRLLTLLVWAAAIMLVGRSGFADERAATELFDSGDYAAAVSAWQEVLETSAHNPDVLYNLGVAQRAAGDLPGAILSFERSLALDPGAADAQQHLDAVRGTMQRELLSASADRKFTQGEPATLVWWRFFHGFGPSLPSMVLLVTWLAAFVALVVRRGVTHTGLRDGLVVMCVCCALVAGAAATIIGGQVVCDDVRPGIVHAGFDELWESPTSMAEHSAPTDLYAGALVRILDEREGWLRVELTDGSRGWLPDTAVGDVRLDRFHR